MSDTTVLVVDDDAPLREVVRLALELAGFRVLEAADGHAALALADRAQLVVLDVAMPRLDGLATCRALRARPDGGPPVLFLSARDEEIDRVLGLELGGDDYVSKPFSPRELVSRVRAILRRAAPASASPTPPSLHGLRLDRDQRRAWVGEVELQLTATELDLLAALTARPGRVYSRDELIEAVYGDGHHLSDRTVDSHLRRIRQKLAAAGCDRVETAQGRGFRFRVDG
jgi:two-component system OmpR family response regulator